MARTMNKPGPKPGPPRRDYHFRLTSEPAEGEAISLADVFDRVVKRHGGDQAFIMKLLSESSEIQAELLKNS